MAKRIKNYSKLEDRLIQGNELGFIKFGSRVDVILPLEADVLVAPGQMVKGNMDKLARFPKV